MPDTSFGRAISSARKSKGWSLKELTARVLREDGAPISPQYLNDIEHDRRSPTSDHMVQQFADALGLERDWLYFLAGRIPEDIRNRRMNETDVTNAMQAFRRSPTDGKGKSPK